MFRGTSGDSGRSCPGPVGIALFGAILNTRLAHHRTQTVPAAAKSQLAAAAAAAGAGDVVTLVIAVFMTERPLADHERPAPVAQQAPATPLTSVAGP